MCLLSSARRLTEAQHFNNWWILLLGRVTGGVATSLLFSVFEAWMVRHGMQAKRFAYRQRHLSRIYPRCHPLRRSASTTSASSPLTGCN